MVAVEIVGRFDKSVDLHRLSTICRVGVSVVGITTNEGSPA
jgi:hypothetical protein